MNLNKHIVWIVPGFASSEKDDTCIPTLLDFLRHLKNNSDIKVSVITLQYPYTNESYQVYGSNIYPMNGKNKWWNRASVWKKALNKLERLNAEHPIHLIHSFWYGDTTLIAEAYHQQKKTQYICTLMGQDALDNNKYIKNSRLAKTHTIALTEIQAETFYRNSGRRVNQIIPFGIPEFNFEAADKKFDICGVGSLIPIKNYEMWIEIISLVKKYIPEVKTILVGDGEERLELENEIEKKDLRSNITLAGKKTRMETLALMDQSKLFLHTSKYEGQAYVLMEAMSRKLGILSTPVGYSLENEKIWKGTSPQGFADEIVHLLRKTEQKVIYKFPSINTTFEKYMPYYL